MVAGRYKCNYAMYWSSIEKYALVEMIIISLQAIKTSSTFFYEGIIWFTGLDHNHNILLLRKIPKLKEIVTFFWKLSSMDGLLNRFVLRSAVRRYRRQQETCQNKESARQNEFPDELDIFKLIWNISGLPNGIFCPTSVCHSGNIKINWDKPARVQFKRKQTNIN